MTPNAMGYIPRARKTSVSSKRMHNVESKDQEVLKVTRSSREPLSAVGSAKLMVTAFYIMGMVARGMAQRAAHSMSRGPLVQRYI